MDQSFGMERPGAHSHAALNAPAKYLIVIDSGGSAVARLFLATREPVAEFDASTDEVSLMTKGLVPSRTAHLPEWDRPLGGHSAKERAAAEVYMLDV